MNEDAYVEMMINDVVESTSFDCAKYDKWLKSHGFVEKADARYLANYVRPYMAFDRYDFKISVNLHLVTYNPQEWECCCGDDPFDNLIIIALKKMIGVEVVPGGFHYNTEFSFQKSRARMLYVLLKNWLLNFMETGDTPEMALRNYCLGIIRAFEEIERMNKNRNADYWLKQWIK